VAQGAFGDVALPGAAQGDPGAAAGLGPLHRAGLDIDLGQLGVGLGHGGHFLRRKGLGDGLHHRILPAAGLEVGQLLGDVGLGQARQARKAGGGHALAVGAVAGDAGHGCRIGAALLHDLATVGCVER